MSRLTFIPKSELDRIRSLDAPAELRADIFATLCRINALSTIAAAGSGHIGSSFSSLDIVTWLHLEEMGPDDIYLSSKGHDVPGLYAVMAGLGVLPFARLLTLRRLGGLPGHPDLCVPGLHANTGSLGMGIAKLKGMARAARLAGRPRRFYGLTGDGELQEGQIWESLVSAANHGLAEITVIVDHNKVQSDIWVAQTSDLGDLDAKFAAFGWHVQRVDGHDMGALAAALSAARAETARPSVIIADTVKGKGVSFMEHRVPAGDRSLYRYHSGAPSEADYAAALQELLARAGELLARVPAPAPVPELVAAPPRPAPPAAPQRLVAAYSRALLEQAGKHPELVALDADLKLDCGLIPFEARFPERYVECGIAEQDMVSEAGGMALAGLFPVVHSFACFLTPRANEQIYNNATEGTRILYVGSLAGILPAGPGHTHQSVRDIALLGSVPGMALLQPCCEDEVALAVDYCVNRAPQSSYLRLTSIPCEIPYVLPAGYGLTPGRGCLLREGRDALFVGYGPVLLAEAWRAAELLAEEGLEVAVANLPWLNAVDEGWWSGLAGRFPLVVTLDDHYLAGGQGEMLAAALARSGAAVRLRSLGLTEVPACGQNREVLAHHGLDAQGLARVVRSRAAGAH